MTSLSSLNLLRQYDASSAVWLASHGKGSYSTIRLWDGKVLMWDMQLTRLTHTLSELGAESSDRRTDKTYLRKLLKDMIGPSLPFVASEFVRCYVHLPVSTNDVHVLVEPLQPHREFERGQIVHIVRDTPDIKSTAWADKRSQVELPPKTEGLVSHNGKIYEGFSSTFYAIRLEEGKAVIQTAFDGALPGTMREIVLAAARELRFAIDTTAPSETAIDEWVSCGVSSTSRGFNYLDAITDVRGTVHNMRTEYGEQLSEHVNEIMKEYYELM